MVSADNSNIEYEHETIIRDHFALIDSNEWTEWADTFIPSSKPLYRGLVSNEDNIENNIGILTINSADIISIQPTDYTLIYPEVADIMETGNHCSYIVELDITVNEETDYFKNGICTRLVTLAQENGEWGVASNSKYIANIARGIGYGYLTDDLDNPPDTVVVDQLDYYDDENRKIYVQGEPIEVDFESFLINTVLGEIGNLDYDTDAIRAITVSDRMYTWFCVLGSYRDAFGCDIIGGFDVAYDPERRGGDFPGTVRTCISMSLDYYVVASNGKIFSVGANNFTGEDYAGSGHVVQSGAQRLALQNKTWQYILHYYLDNSTYNVPYSTGTVIIGTSEV